MISDLWRIVGLTYITPQLAETITSVLQAKEELNRRRYIESLEEKVRKLQSNQKLKDIITKLK
jgi:hypothetical protein